MAVLIETRMNSLKLCEDKDRPQKKGCLGRLEGICADFKTPTRNGRLYPLGLWKKVFANALFKEALESKTLFGELDHPEDRFEPLMSEACVVMTDYKIDEDAGVIYGGFDILDTPKGRVLKAILDYGSVVGVSSRGQGDIIESVDGERVDEDSYDFACFDVVSTPAVEKARQKVAESVKRSFKESVEKQIKDAKSVADLNIIRSVVRSSELKQSDMDTIIESIEDRCNSLQNVGETISTQENVEESTCVLESANTIRDNKKLYTCINSLRKQVSAYKYREGRFVESVKSKQSEIDKLSKQLDAVKQTSKVKSERNAEQLNTVKENFSKKYARSQRTLTESKEQVQNLINENTKLKNTLRRTENSSSVKISELTERLDAKQREIDTLKEQVNNLNQDVNHLRKENMSLSDSHETEIERIDNEVDNYSQLLSEAQEKISCGNDKIHQLNETLKKCETQLEMKKNENKKLAESLRQFQNSYTSMISDMSGIDADSIYHSIGSDTTPQQIQKLVEGYRDKMDRFNKLGISKTGLIGTDISTVGKTDPESERLTSFLKMTQESL